MTTNPKDTQNDLPADSEASSTNQLASSVARKIRIGTQRSASDMQKMRRTSPATEQGEGGQTKTDVKSSSSADVKEAVAVIPEPTSALAPVAVPPAKDAAEALPPPPPSGAVVALPELTDELEREIDAALGDLSLDQMISGEELTNSGDTLEVDARLKATVVKIHRENVFFSLGARNEGLALLKQFDEPPEVGAVLEVIITKFNAEEGLYELAIPGASVSVSDWSDVAEGMVVEAMVTGSNTGGLECQINRLSGFIPASQIALYRVENFAEFVGQKLQCVVTEANPQRRNLVLSHRAMLERQREETREAFLENLEVGQVHEGTVRSLKDFGAFVDLGGVDGLIHISKMSWDRIDHPSEVLKEGQTVQVKIEKIDRQAGKIGLSYRDLLENPWADVEGKYPAGAIVDGAVSRIAKFGAFVKLEPGVEGLIHISELAHHRVNQVSSVVSEGQEVQVKVVSVNKDDQRIGLSLKATLAAPVADKADTEDDVPLREMAVPRRNAPLKGGFDRPSGGDQFGLRW